MSENSIDTARKATPKSLVKCVETAFRIKRSIMIMGQPGVGKSQIIAQIANRSNRPVIDMRLAQFDSTDIRGVPYFDPETKKIISAGIVGPNAGDLIGEAVLAIEMGADAEDIGLSIHPHPTLTETVANAAEMFSGTITDLYIPK
mgnify:CR=1 FL=1